MTDEEEEEEERDEDGEDIVPTPEGNSPAGASSHLTLIQTIVTHEANSPVTQVQEETLLKTAEIEPASSQGEESKSHQPAATCEASNEGETSTVKTPIQCTETSAWTTTLGRDPSTRRKSFYLYINILILISGTGTILFCGLTKESVCILLYLY